MQNLDLGSTYGTTTVNNATNPSADGDQLVNTSNSDPNIPGGDNLNFDPDLPAPPQDNNQVAAWYDTDL